MNAIVLLINLYPLELIHKLQKLMLAAWNMQSVMKVFKNRKEHAIERLATKIDNTFDDFPVKK